MDAPLARFRATAAGRGRHAVRWSTADDGHRARGTDGQVPHRTVLVTYAMAPDAAG
ncbi:hypothetical protein OG618_05055 [Kitasatospora sp. NBC_01246]|uniref:hypothetical protein n=1 Tax=Kitasatospora sp. NBC_01246 TaxID=2903570 RepID=UPI002E364DC3|nr:hypothetical protein [Kitasatospora sp. NBC_01246]